MTESRSHLAGTTPFQNRIPVRLLAPQHVKGRLGQMARHCSNGFVVSLTLAQAVIELADVPLRTAPVIDGHRFSGLHTTPLQVAGPGRSQPSVPPPAAAGVYPRGGSCIAGQMRGVREAANVADFQRDGSCQNLGNPWQRHQPLHLRRDLHQILQPLLELPNLPNQKIDLRQQLLADPARLLGQRFDPCLQFGRALFPYASLYSLGGTPYLASVAVRRFFSRVRCSTSTSRVRVNSRKSRNGLGGIHTVGSVPLRCRRLSPCTSSLSVLLISPIISLALRG